VPPDGMTLVSVALLDDFCNRKNKRKRGSVGSQPHVRAVERAVQILEQFSLDRPELNLTEVSAGIGLSKSTVHRLLATLEATQMVEFDRRTNHYRLGLKAFRFGSIVSKSMELVRQADPLMKTLVDETDETSFLLVVDGNEALCLRRFDGRHHVRVLSLEPGRRSAFNCGSAQRVLLAHLSESQWDVVVDHHVRRMTQYSLVSRDELDRDRREIRERGYSVSWEDATLHACALGAPVRDSTGKVIAAVSVSGIVQRFSAERLPTLIRKIMEVGDELSLRLGYFPAASASETNS
jgi:IclR family KDG regulon transcriptional repressor